MSYLYAFIAGLFIGAATLFVWQKPIDKTEPVAAEQRQADGSLALARTPDANARPAHAIPKGGKAERKISVSVQPARADCPICKVDFTLVRLPDDTRRVVTSSPTGTVVGGLDVPIVPVSLARPKVWSVGTLYNGHWGILAVRDLDWLSVGGAVTTERRGGAAPWVVVILHF